MAEGGGYWVEVGLGEERRHCLVNEYQTAFVVTSHREYKAIKLETNHLLDATIS